MCGIAGIYSYKNILSCVNADELQKMCSHMKTRGPDGEGQWYSRNRHVGLAHRRLSIIDVTDNASQPLPRRVAVVLPEPDPHVSTHHTPTSPNFPALRMSRQTRGYETGNCVCVGRMSLVGRAPRVVNPKLSGNVSGCWLCGQRVGGG